MTEEGDRPGPELSSEKEAREIVLARLAARGLVRTEPSSRRRPAEPKDEDGDGPDPSDREKPQGPPARPVRLVYPPGMGSGHDLNVSLAAQRHRTAGGAHRRRTEPEAPVGRRRTLLAAGGAVVVVLALVLGGLAAAGGISPADRSRAACARYDQMRGQLANGSLSGPQLTDALSQIRSQAAGGLPDVASAASRLAEVGAPGTSSFLIASTALADACYAVPRG